MINYDLQAIKALKEEGIDTVVINPNVATVQVITKAGADAGADADADVDAKLATVQVIWLIYKVMRPMSLYG